MKISIIGGCGFIGQSLLFFFLKKNYEIKIIDTQNRFNKTKLKKINFFPINYNNNKSINKAINGTDVLINLYSSIDPSSSMKVNTDKIIKDIKINKRIFKIAKKLSIKKIIFASSGGTIYGGKNRFPINERFKTKPISNYGKVKLISENILKKMSINNYYILRMSNVYGPLQFNYSKIGIISKIIESLNKNKKLIIWGDGSIVRDFLYIDDLSSIVDILIKRNIKKGTYNISSSSGISINELIIKINKITNKKCNVVYKMKRNFDVPKNILSFEKILIQTGWTPKIKLEQGIKKMFEKYFTCF